MSFWSSIGNTVSGIDMKKILNVEASSTKNYDKYNKKYIKTVTVLKSKSQAMQEVLRQDDFQALSKKLVKLKQQTKEI